MSPYFLLVAAWAIYFFLHSLLASTRVKKFFPVRIYRIGYVLFSTGGLLFILFYNETIPGELLLKNDGLIRYVSLVFTAFGVIVIRLAFRQYSIKEFVGLGEEKEVGLNTEGILSSIRHPIYAGTVLIVLGFFFFLPNLPTLISCACIFIYLPIGIYLEEKKLIATYGEAYLEYKKRVPSLIPRSIKF